MNIKLRLTVMNFMQFAVWGSYLVCIGNFLGRVGLGSEISWFYVVQGIVSIFMPAILGAIADKFVQPQRLLGIAHLVAGVFMIAAGMYARAMGSEVPFWTLFSLYTVSVAFYMPTIALSNTVAFSILTRFGFDTIKDFPPIRVFGTVGFIAAMWFVNFAKFGFAESFQFTYMQLIVSGVLGILLALYSFTLPQCPIDKSAGKKEKTLAQRLGLDAFVLFKQKKMALFFIFSMLLGVSLQITNGFATPYINSFAMTSDSWFAQNPTLLTSLSQASEALCILLIPFFLGRFGIKRVMLIAMGAWVLRFALFGAGNPGNGVWMFILSMLVYGVAFDFFNVSGSLFVDKETDISIRSSAQGLFIIMTNGIGATVGTLSAQWVVNRFVDFNSTAPQIEGWSCAWYIFAGYALIVAVVFAFVFKYKHVRK